MREETKELKHPAGTRLYVDMVEITRPERWWLATADLLPWLTDPDVDDGRLRHTDRHEIRWEILARILTDICSAWQAARYTASTEVTNTIEVHFPAEAGGLTLEENEILESWFDYAEAVRADPWVMQLVDGRHRVWNVWDHNPSAWLPIRSEVLDYLDVVDERRQAFAATVRISAREGLKKLPKVVAQRSPLYAAELDAAAAVIPGKTDQSTAD